MKYLVLEQTADKALAEKISRALWGLSHDPTPSTVRWVSKRQAENGEWLLAMPSDALPVAEDVTEQEARDFVDLFRGHISDSSAEEMEQTVLEKRGERVPPPDVLVEEIRDALYDEEVLIEAGLLPEPEMV